MRPFFIYVLVPFSRPLMAGNILANFNRQNYKNKKLVVIANGEAKNTNIECDKLLKSDNNAASAKNDGIYWLKRNGEEYFTIFDDDDFYGEGYLDEIYYYRNQATVIGKNIHYFKCESGMYLANEGTANKFVKYIHGPTLSCHSKDAPFYSTKFNEEKSFCNKVLTNGGTIYNTSVDNYIYMRNGLNTWKISDKELINTLNAKRVSWEK